MNILLGKSSWHPAWFMCFKKSICFTSLGWTLKYKFVYKKYYGSGPTSAKRITSSSQLPTIPHTESKDTWTQGRGICSEEPVKLGYWSITPPFQTATNLCTEIRSLEPQHSSDLSLRDFSTARNKKNQKPSRTTPSSLLLTCGTSGETPIPPVHTS